MSQWLCHLQCLLYNDCCTNHSTGTERLPMTSHEERHWQTRHCNTVTPDTRWSRELQPACHSKGHWSTRSFSGLRVAFTYRARAGVNTAIRLSRPQKTSDVTCSAGKQSATKLSPRVGELTAGKSALPSERNRCQAFYFRQGQLMRIVNIGSCSSEGALPGG